jgi:hypothetical protein
MGVINMEQKRPYGTPDAALTTDEWTAVSWVLNHGFIQNCKWLWAEREAQLGSKDYYGTPNTVEQILGIAEGMKKSEAIFNSFSHEGLRGLYILAERIAPADMEDARKLLIEWYLMGTDSVNPMRVIIDGKANWSGIVPDQHGANQLEGELKRYWAHHNRYADPRNVDVTRIVIEHFCRQYGISDSAPRFAARLDLIK